VGGVLTAELAEFLELELVGGLLLILGGRIILTLALGAIQTHDHAHTYFLLLKQTEVPNGGGVTPSPWELRTSPRAITR
jgi:hypothetical protein